MTLAARTVILFSLFLSFYGTSSCKDKKSSKGGGGGAVASPTPIAAETPAIDARPMPTPSSTPNLDDCVKSIDQTLLTEDNQPNWSDDIEEIFGDKCVKCHGSEGNSPDLTSYAKASAAASKIGDRISSGSMPPSRSSQLTGAQKTKIEKWLQAGTPRNSSGSASTDCNDSTDQTPVEGGRTDDEGGGDNAGNDDDVGSNSGPMTWERFLNPQELEDCHASGKLYDRRTEDCHKAELTDEWSCTRSGISRAFKKFNISVGSDLDQIEDDGYEIDQCGEYKDEPIVLFYKKVTNSSDEMKLKILRLCKKGSKLCSR